MTFCAPLLKFVCLYLIVKDCLIPMSRVQDEIDLMVNEIDKNNDGEIQFDGTTAVLYIWFCPARISIFSFLRHFF